MIRTVIFDIDGTMYDCESCNQIAMEAVEQYCLVHMNVDTNGFHQAIRKANTIMKERMGGSCAAIHNRLIRFQCMLEVLGLPLFPYAQDLYHTYWDTFLDGMEAYPGLKTWMKHLRGNGIRIGVGTNMTAYMQYQKLKKLNVGSLIDWIVTSEEAGAEKPDERFFRQCVEKNNMAAEACLFVGDSLEGDIKGALSCGMKALLFAPVSRENSSMDPEIWAVNSFHECMEDRIMRQMQMDRPFIH